MNKILLLSLLLLLIIGCGKTVDEATLLERNGLKYLPNSEDPYSGQVYSLNANEQKEMEGFYQDGMKDGLWTEWWGNGQMKSNSSYKTGKEDGLFTYWYENGQKSKEQFYKDGELDGATTAWDENGKKIAAINNEELSIIDGVSYTKDTNVLYSGLVFAMYENGQIRYEGILRAGKEDGLFTFWYENGQRKFEGVFRGGKWNGLFTFWHENGQKSMEQSYKDGELDGATTAWNENGQEIDQEVFVERDALLESVNYIASRAASYWRRPYALGGGALSFVGVTDVTTFYAERSNAHGTFIMSSIQDTQFTLTASGLNKGVVIIATITYKGVSGTPEITIPEF